MAQQMGATVRGMQIGAGQGAAHDGADGTAVVESPPRCSA
jgi:hypothetical protein